MAKKRAFDKVLFTAVVVLSVFGLVMVYSASAPRTESFFGHPLFVRQAAAAVVGLAAMGLTMHLDYRVLRRPLVIYALLAGVLALLVAVLFHPPINNTRRWLVVGPLSVQPSELAKLVMVPFLAYLIDRREGDVNRREFLLPAVFLVGLTAALVMAEPDLGTAALLLSVAGVVVFLAGLSLRNMMVAAAVGLPALAVLVASAGYRLQRFQAFLAPEEDPLGRSYQALQSLIAVGSGGIFGRGLGASVQKLRFLPQPESDFIFAIIAEELGLLGTLAVLAAFGVVLWRGMRAGARAPDAFGRYLAWGFTVLLTLQAVVHTGVAVALVPTTGIPLPFLSYGGSAMVVALTASGVLLNVSEHG